MRTWSAHAHLVSDDAEVCGRSVISGMKGQRAGVCRPDRWSLCHSVTHRLATWYTECLCSIYIGNVLLRKLHKHMWACEHIGPVWVEVKKRAVSIRSGELSHAFPTSFKHLQQVEEFSIREKMILGCSDTCTSWLVLCAKYTPGNDRTEWQIKSKNLIALNRFEHCEDNSA